MFSTSSQTLNEEVACSLLDLEHHVILVLCIAYQDGFSLSGERLSPGMQEGLTNLQHNTRLSDRLIISGPILVSKTGDAG